jgi:ABC-type lipoprotein export system ATPase subunit
MECTKTKRRRYVADTISYILFFKANITRHIFPPYHMLIFIHHHHLSLSLLPPSTKAFHSNLSSPKQPTRRTIMTLTVCVGSSGSGKTTFLNDVHELHKCTYLRQYHNLRPYITVSKIPNFDPSKLPYWDIYLREKKDKIIIVGGTLAGNFMAGLSGGQRKILLFELISQRTITQDNLLIILDEPFAGVTDDFIPFIVEHLNDMRQRHNILLVTNDHVDTLKEMADNTITVNAIDRSKIKVNGIDRVDRDLAIMAMAIGDEYKYNTTNEDVKFFGRVEFSMRGGLPSVVVYAASMYGLFLLMFWGSKQGFEALILLAAKNVSWYVCYPYFMQIVDWRVYMIEEMHVSRSTNKL